MDIKKAKRFKAFTLLELVVVIAIIAVLTAIIVPNTITYFRDAKITSANDKAQQLYMATQDYLVDLQLRGQKADTYFGNDSGVGFLRNENIAGVKVGVVDGVGSGAVGTKATEASNEILERLSGDFEGAWIVAVYPGTYTVKYAVYSEAPPQNGATTNFNLSAVKNIGDTGGTLYTAVWGGSGSQEYDAKFNKEKAYTGQYPVPVTSYSSSGGGGGSGGGAGGGGAGGGGTGGGSGEGGSGEGGSSSGSLSENSSGGASWQKTDDQPVNQYP